MKKFGSYRNCLYLCSEKSKIYVMETTKRRRATVRLPEYAMADIQNQAKRQNRSVNSILAMYILDGLYHEPNETTLAAMAECDRLRLGTHHELFGK